MPDKDGKLSQEEKQSIIEFVNSRWKPPVLCPVCGKGEWFIADHLVIPITLGENFVARIGSGPSYPYAMLISNHCGYTMFINAAIIGTIKPAPTDTPAEKIPEGEKKG